MAMPSTIRHIEPIFAGYFAVHVNFMAFIAYEVTNIITKDTLHKE